MCVYHIVYLVFLSVYFIVQPYTCPSLTGSSPRLHSFLTSTVTCYSQLLYIHIHNISRVKTVSLSQHSFPPLTASSCTVRPPLPKLPSLRSSLPRSPSCYLGQCSSCWGIVSGSRGAAGVLLSVAHHGHNFPRGSSHDIKIAKFICNLQLSKLALVIYI